MAEEISKSQIDRLGDRLKKGNIGETELRMLDQYRRSYTEAYEIVVGAIRKELSLEPTGRPAKSTTSIAEKLRRESIRLTQIQDIAGCRLIVSDVADQERVIQSLSSLFEHTTIVDRRQQPSHGYRAVHVIARCHSKMIEIQVRTLLQDRWAELSEKLSDVLDPGIKYGGGDELVHSLLICTSSMVIIEECFEMDLADAQLRLSSQDSLMEDEKQQMANFQEKLSSERLQIFEQCRDAFIVILEVAAKMELADVLAQLPSADALAQLSPQAGLTNYDKQQIANVQEKLGWMKQQIFEGLRDAIGLAEKLREGK